MKLLATIKSVEITRTYPHQDGTFGNVYGVTIESGNDTIIAETFRTAESQKKAGIVLWCQRKKQEEHFPWEP